METTKALFFELDDFHSERWNGIVLRAAHGVLVGRDSRKRTHRK